MILRDSLFSRHWRPSGIRQKKQVFGHEDRQDALHAVKTESFGKLRYQ